MHMDIHTYTRMYMYTSLYMNVCVHICGIYTYIWVDMYLGSNIFDRHFHEMFVNMHQTLHPLRIHLGKCYPRPLILCGL